MKTTALLLTGFVLAFSAEAKSRVAILNAQAAVLSTEEGKAAVAEFARRFQPYQTELSDEQREIETLQGRLDSGDARTAAETEEIKARIATLAASHRHKVEEFDRRLAEEQRRVLTALAAKLLPVVEKYAKQRHFELILDESDPKAPIYWRAKATDITAEVVKRYDQSARAKPSPRP